MRALMLQNEILPSQLNNLAAENREFRAILGNFQQELLPASHTQPRFSNNPHSFMRAIEGATTTTATTSDTQPNERRLNN